MAAGIVRPAYRTPPGVLPIAAARLSEAGPLSLLVWRGNPSLAFSQDLCVTEHQAAADNGRMIAPRSAPPPDALEFRAPDGASVTLGGWRAGRPAVLVWFRGDF